MISPVAAALGQTRLTSPNPVLETWWSMLTQTLFLASSRPFPALSGSVQSMNTATSAWKSSGSMYWARV